MANEISIVVRTTDAASRGFDKIGKAAVGMNAAIDAAGSALDSLDAIQQSGTNKATARAQAQNDVAQALVDQRQAELDLKQATIDANQAQLDASQAQTDYNDAVKKFGKNSQQAKQAQADLTQAQYDSAQATADMKQAQVDATQAQIDLNAAQRELNPTLVQQMSQKFQELAPAVGLATMAGSAFAKMMNLTRIRTIAAAAATKAMAVAQRVLNLAMSMNPIGLVIAALVLLGVALVVAYKKSSTFRAVVQAAFRGVQAAGRVLWSAVRTYFQGLATAFRQAAAVARTVASALASAFRGVVAAARALSSGASSAFRAVSSAFRTVASVASSVAGSVRSRLSSIVATARGIPGRIRSAFSGLYSAITTPVRNAVNAVRSWLNGLLAYARSIPSKIGNSVRSSIGGGVRGALGKLNPFAHGGVVGQAASGATSSGLTMTGENGPELLHLPPGTRVRSNPGTRRWLGDHGGGGVAAIYIDAAPNAYSQFLLAELRKYARTNKTGTRPVMV